MEKNTTATVGGSRWGLWATLGFGLIIFILDQVVAYLGTDLLYSSSLNENPNLDVDAFYTALESDGFYISVYTIVSLFIYVGLIVFFVVIRKGITVKQYLYLKPVPLGTLVRWLGVTVVLVLVWDGLHLILGRPIVPDSFVAIYKTADNYPLFWFAIVFAAPVLEEFFFRGFIFDGIRDSRLGSIGAVVITSMIWAILHFQYDYFDISLVAIDGLILGAVKIKTRSLYTTIAMHSLVNLIATLEVAIFI